jgi:enoyl-CoA hydratase/carnithine racemase
VTNAKQPVPALRSDSKLEKKMANVTLEIDDALAIVTVSRPPLNLFTWEMLAELSDVIDQVAAAPLRALLLKASGHHFSAGADVPAMFDGLSAHAAEARLAKHIPLMERLQALPIPTIAAVRGLCMTAGLEIVLRCDVLWASETAQFAQLEAMIGATTLLGGAQILCERAGPARAAEICYSTSTYSVADFERWGIVTRIIPDAELDDAAAKFAKQLSEGPTRALQATKRLIRAAAQGGAYAADRLVGVVGAPLLETHDMQAGVKAVAEHGARNFRGKFSFQGK